VDFNLPEVCPGVVAGSQPGHTFPEPDVHGRSPKDTKAAPFEFRRRLWEPEGHLTTRNETVRDREAPGSNPGPPTNFEFKIADFERRRKTVGRREVTAVSQTFLEVGRDRPRSTGLRPSIELAYGYRTADISERARPQDREASGFENQRRCPRRCAADAQVRTVRHLVQNPRYIGTGKD
jgi:hypothetical protein